MSVCAGLGSSWTGCLPACGVRRSQPRQRWKDEEEDTRKGVQFWCFRPGSVFFPEEQTRFRKLDVTRNRDVFEETAGGRHRLSGRSEKLYKQGGSGGFLVL